MHDWIRLLQHQESNGIPMAATGRIAYLLILC